jgi:hypothetical protein
MTNGDGERFELLDQEIDKVEKQVADIKQIQETPLVKDEVVHPEWQSWVSKNPWYQSTAYMRAFADEVGLQFASRGMSPPEVLKEVEKAVRKEFPQKFTNPNKEHAPEVGSSRSSGPSSKRDDIELTDQERRVMNTLIASDPKTFTKEKYIADLKKIRGLK